MITKFATLAMTVVMGAVVGASAASADSINDRQARQEKRIFNGVANGRLNQREFHKLERGQQHIQNLERKARASGGGINGVERDRIQDALDRQSDRVFDKKHNGR